MEPIGIAIVGCGYWGINYVRIFGELTGSTVLFACDLDVEQLERVRRRFPGVKASLSIAPALADPAVSAIVVATPLSSHYTIVKECLQANKHVLVEKPFVRLVAEAQELVDLADQRDLTLMIGHTFLYNPAVRKMKECIQDQSCGQIYYLHATRTNLGPIRKDANALWDLVPHDVAIFGYLLDTEPLWVTAVASKPLHSSREDVGFVTLAYPEGILGHVHVSWLDPNKVREVVVVGSRKRIVFNDLNNMEKIRIFEKGISPVETEVSGYGEFQLLIRDGDIVSPRIDAGEPLKNQCLHFLSCIEQHSVPFSDGRNGLNVVKVLAAIDESVRQLGAPVPVSN